MLAIVSCLALASCKNGGPREETDDKDSIEAVRSADSLLQQELNADTSASSLDSVDSLSEDNSQQGGTRK